MFENSQALVGFSVVVGFITDLILIWVVSWLLEKCKRGNLLDVIYDAKGYPSLSRFQFLLWTLIILGAFTIASLIRLLGAMEFEAVEIPENLVYLLGISVSIVPVSAHVSKKKYGDTTTMSKEWKEGTPRPRKPFGTILTENGNPSLAKFQMFSWTIISVIIYLVLCGRVLNSFAIGSSVDVFLPEIDFSLVALMGLSQAAYVGGKWGVPEGPVIESVDPREITESTDRVTIKGIRFGKTKGSILIDTVKIEPDNIAWDENRIAINIKPSYEALKQLRRSEFELRLMVGSKEATEKITFK